MPPAKAAGRKRQREAENEAEKQRAIVLSESPEDDQFLRTCAVYCELDCCGFNAIEISEIQFQRAVTELGLDTSRVAVKAMKDQIERIGEHAGYVRFHGYYESAQTIKSKYQEVCATLERLINAESGRRD